MGNVTIIIVALLLTVFNTYTASIDRTTEFPDREPRIPTGWLLNRVARYLSINDLYNLYKADHILANRDSLEKDIMRRVKYYEIENNITLDRAVFDNDALHGSPNFRVKMYMVPRPLLFQDNWDNWNIYIDLPNCLFSMCHMSLPPIPANIIHLELTSTFVLQPGYYEPRIRVNISEYVIVRHQGNVSISFSINGNYHSFQQIDETTVNDLNQFQSYGHYLWFKVRFPIIRVITPNSTVDWSLHTKGVWGVIFGGSEMWLTNAAASQNPVDPSAVHIDPRGDALVSNSYRLPPTTTITPSELGLKGRNQERRIENGDTTMPKAKMLKI